MKLPYRPVSSDWQSVKPKGVAGPRVLNPLRDGLLQIYRITVQVPTDSSEKMGHPVLPYLGVVDEQAEVFAQAKYVITNKRFQWQIFAIGRQPSVMVSYANELQTSITYVPRLPRADQTLSQIWQWRVNAETTMAYPPQQEVQILSGTVMQTQKGINFPAQKKIVTESGEATIEDLSNNFLLWSYSIHPATLIKSFAAYHQLMLQITNPE